MNTGRMLDKYYVDGQIIIIVTQAMVVLVIVMAMVMVKKW